MTPGVGAERASNAKLSPRSPQNELPVAEAAQSLPALTAAPGSVGKGSLKHYFGCIVESKKNAQVIVLLQWSVPAWMMFCPAQPQRHQTPLLQRDVQAENGNFSTVEPRPRVNSTQGQLCSTAVAAAIGAQGHQCLLKGGISQKALWLWSRLTAPPADHPHGNQLRKDGKETWKLCHKAAICYRELLLIFSYHKNVEEQVGRDLKGPLV